MPPKTNLKNCEGQGEGQHCDDHSGLTVWMRGIAGLLTLSSCLLGYSVFWQAPNIRLDIAKEIARLDGKDKDMDHRLDTLEKDVKCIDDKITRLTSTQ